MSVAKERYSPLSSTLEELNGNPVYMSQKLAAGKGEHDARGLVIAILLSVASWAILGYFLLI